MYRITKYTLEKSLSQVFNIFLTERSSASHCRHWLESGHCPYGSKCKKASTHSLVSPSKRSDVPAKERPPSSGKRHGSPALDTDWMNWDEENLDFDDELMLEKKRQLLERELAKQVLFPELSACGQLEVF